MKLRPPSNKEVIESLIKMGCEKAFLECVFHDNPKMMDLLIKKFNYQNYISLLYMSVDFVGADCMIYLLENFLFSNNEIDELYQYAKEKYFKLSKYNYTLLANTVYKMKYILRYLENKNFIYNSSYKIYGKTKIN